MAKLRKRKKTSLVARDNGTDALKEDVSTDVTSDRIGSSVAANKVDINLIGFQCVVNECHHKYFAKRSLIEHMINGHQIEDMYECEDCDDVCLSAEALNGHKHRAHTSATVVSTRETSDGLATESSLQRHIHETNALTDNQTFETENRVELSGHGSGEGSGGGRPAKVSKTSSVVDQSLDKQQTQTHAKDSMDRFGDDLYGLLLSYIPIKQRFRLKIMSKQFLRMAFASVVDIDITDPLLQHKDYANTDIIRALTAIGKMCPHIETIYCRGIELTSIQSKHILNVLDTIGDQFPNLQHIRFNWLSKRDKELKLIGKYSSETDVQAFNQCYRLSYHPLLSVDQLVRLFGATSELLLEKKLTSFAFKYRRSDNYQLFSRLYDRLCYRHNGINDTNNETFKQFGQQLLALPQLQHLLLDICLYGNSLADYLDTIGVNCEQVIELTLGFDSYSEQKVQALDALKRLPRLKRLNLFLANDIDWHVLEPLRHCRRVTHLRLYIQKVVDNALVFSCDKDWPHIQYLFIFHYNHRIGVETLENISRLPDLQTLIIAAKYSTYGGLNDHHFEDLLNSCPKLKNITIEDNYGSKSYCR